MAPLVIKKETIHNLEAGAPPQPPAWYLPLSSHVKVLACQEVRLVSLLYGDVASEIAALQRDMGIGLIEEPSIDKFHETDGLASLLDVCAE